MKVLGIDTSTKNLSVAIVEDSKTLAEFKGRERLRHSQDLIPTIEALLKSEKLKLNELDGFAISIGPGSFTGLRIGVATLKGLNLVTGKPITAVPTLDTIANNISESSQDICVIVDAKKNNVYSCVYYRKNGKIERKSGYLLVTVQELLEKLKAAVIFVGDGIALYKDAILEKINSAQFAKEETWFPKAGIVAALGMEKLEKNEIEDADSLVPMYLYSRECSIRGIDR